MSIYKQSESILSEMIEHRRYLHENPEVGLSLPNTVNYVMQKLAEMGYSPQELGGGVVATVGKKDGKTILLRADMDALPMEEDSGLDFSSKNSYAHTCGHDMHTAYLLGAAKLLKENEDVLEGTVKLMFQPAEEIGEGAKSMIKAGLLENPTVHAAIGTHVMPSAPVNTVILKNGVMMASSGCFEINITGKGGHGSTPSETVDPINIGVHIHLALQELISREKPFDSNVSLTIGCFNAGSTSNIIPHTAKLIGTLRTLSHEDRDFFKKRIIEVSKNVAKTYRGTASVEFIAEIPILFNDEKIYNQVKTTLENMKDVNLNIVSAPPIPGSEDFSCVINEVPGIMIFLGANLDGSDTFLNHHPKVRFNEDALTSGAAILTDLAINWLKDNK